LFVPNATLLPVTGTDVDVDVDVDVEDVVGLWLLEHADKKTKVARSTTVATAIDWCGKRGCIRAILFGSLAANQRISSHETRDPASRVTGAVRARQRRTARPLGHARE